MLRLFKRNPLQCISLHQIAQTQLACLPSGVFSVFFYSSASSNLPQESPKTEDPITDFFHSYGFTDTQIKRCVLKCPTVRSIDFIKPKFERLLAFGLCRSELSKVIFYDPEIINTSLENRIEPRLKFLEQTIGSKTNAIKALSRCPWLLRHDLEKQLIPNLKIFRETGIPMEKITRLFTMYPGVFQKDPYLIIETINKLKGLGMSPSTLAFIYGMNVIATCKKETWEKKLELFRSFGWSEEDTLSAFSQQPTCMQFSEDKITKAFKFFKEKLQWDSVMVLRWPVVLTFSLEERIIPRCAVMSVLAKNGLWNGKPKLYSIFTMKETTFKERFVDKYEKGVPQVIDAYQRKLDFMGFESNYEIP